MTDHDGAGDERDTELRLGQQFGLQRRSVGREQLATDRATLTRTQRRQVQHGEHRGGNPHRHEDEPQRDDDPRCSPVHARCAGDRVLSPARSS
ncbi:MAG: hypothetical protein ACT4NP_16980 [Pseudonocardiales bacterium]